MLLRKRFEQLRRIAPKHSTTGQMYKDGAHLKLRFRRVTLYVLLVSEENTHMMHPAIFKRDHAMTSKEWAGWFSRNFAKIYTGSILPGIALRTSKSWSVRKIIGWVGSVKHSVDDSKMAKRRHKTKSKRGKSG